MREYIRPAALNVAKEFIYPDLTLRDSLGFDILALQARQEAA